jgi:VWFA-related protein
VQETRSDPKHPKHPKDPKDPIRLLVAAVLLLTGISAPAAAQDPPRYTEKVDVARILLDVRAYDPRGRPLLGLEPANFEVKIDGRRARVESVEHITGDAVVSSSPTTTPLPHAGDGRLLVFLFQKSLERSRIPGLMAMLRELRERVATFGRHDRVAVLRFDSNLDLLLDFTHDRDLVLKAFEHDVLFGAAADRGESQEPSMRAAMDRERASPSDSIEEALLRIAEALESLPGPKSVVLVGHGFGLLNRTGVLLDTDYDEAREALQRARASVFCLDVTNADYHSLEAGLMTVAEDTGGLYERTHVFSRLALGRVLAAVEGQYVLFVEGPPLKPGSHRLNVRLRGRDGVVLAPNNYVNEDAPPKR